MQNLYDKWEFKLILYLGKFCSIKIHLNVYIFDSEILFLRIYTKEKVLKYHKNAPNAYNSLIYYLHFNTKAFLHKLICQHIMEYYKTIITILT